MAALPGIYRAKAASVSGTTLTAFIPQIFGDLAVPVTEFVGGMPTATAMGWVAFHGGNADKPVWLGGGDGGGVTDAVWVGPNAPAEASTELWFDTDETVAQTVTGSRDGNAALLSLLTALETLGLITNSTSA